MVSLTFPFSVQNCTILSFLHSILLIMCNLKGLPIAWTKMVWDCWVTWDRPLPTARYQQQQKLTWQPFSPWSEATWQLFSPTGHFYLSLTKLTVSLSQKESADNKDYHWRPKKLMCLIICRSGIVIWKSSMLSREGCFLSCITCRVAEALIKSQQPR